MENKKKLTDHVSDVFVDFKTYLELKYQHTRLDAIEKLVAMAAYLTAVVAVMFIAIGILLFSSFALGFFFGQLLDNDFLGFLIMAGIYLLIAIILYSFRRTLIIRPVQNNLLKTIFKADNSDSDSDD